MIAELAASPSGRAAEPALGTDAANHQPAIETGAVLSPGPDAATLDLAHLPSVFPPHSPANDPAIAAEATATALKIPNWSAKVTSFGKTYTFTMVGQTVLGSGAGTTKLKFVIVPLEFVFTNGTLDATNPIAGCSPAAATTLIAGSPLFQNVKLVLGKTNVGTSQYIDLFQRANFWNYIASKNPNYHTVFIATQAPVVTIKVNGAASAATCATGAAGGLGTLNFAGWDRLVQKTLLPALKKYVNPGVLPVFLSYDVVFGGAAGYHNMMSTPAGIQTYAVSTFLDLAGAPPDSEVLSHELGEWLDDPLTTNPTPAWGHIGQVTGCQTNLEVGDPLTGLSFATATMKNGYTYTVQDLTFFSWFYRGSPSIGVNGQYTLFNYFSGAQAICK
jgi:hypothetical protein